MDNDALLIFVKNPVAGRVKTRLAQSVGDKMALDIYLKLIYHTIEITKDLAVRKLVYYSDYLDRDDTWPNVLFDKKLQKKTPKLGERLKSALLESSGTYDKIVVIGSDCPELTTKHIEDAFTALKDYDLVIGPALDGGFYLLGLNTWHEDLFKEISWSTSAVLDQLLSNASSLNVRLLDPLNDIDTLEDWVNFTSK